MPAIGLSYWLCRRCLLFSTDKFGQSVCMQGVKAVLDVAARNAAHARALCEISFRPCAPRSSSSNRRYHDLRLDHERGKPAVAAGNLGLPDHGGAAAMQRGALGPRRLADRDYGEEIGLALDRRRARALG